MTPIDTAQLRAIAAAATTTQDGECPRCSPLQCAGWEALPPGFDESALQALGTLCPPDDALGNAPEPDLTEYHPAGTRYWSADAPIAPAFHPYNRCTVAACVACGRAFLRYTEYGGYYVVGPAIFR